MIINLSKPQIRQIRLALYLAMEWERSVIDALTPKYGPHDPEFYQSIRKCKRNIQNFHHLRDFLHSHLSPRE